MDAEGAGGVREAWKELGFCNNANPANQHSPRPGPPPRALLVLTHFILTTKVGSCHYPAHVMEEETQVQEA